MSFTDHKITQFQHRIADLPDEPQIPAADLKSRFDACPEVLRQSLNAVCDDAARLEARVEGIVVDTFGDTIDKEMLSDELAAELDAKADQAEMEQTMLKRSDLYFGYYAGNSTFPRDINLGFQPRAVFIKHADGISSNGRVYSCLAVPIDEEGVNTYCKLTETGFRLTNSDERSSLNTNYNYYVYIALK